MMKSLMMMKTKTTSEVDMDLGAIVKELADSIIKDLHLAESKIITKVNSKGEKRRRRKCKPGYKLNAAGTSCVPITGGEKATKRRAIRKAIRTKRAMGKGFQIRVKRKRLKALRRRKAYGL